jgi:N-acetylmuramoyl-L-alanine amidase
VTRARPALLIAALVVSTIGAQPAPPRQFTVIRSDGRSQLAVTMAGGRAMVSLADVATLVPLTVKEDTVAGALTVTVNGRHIVLSPGQNLASVEGKLVSLPAPAVRSGSTWLVPVEFLSRALSLVAPQPIDVRPQSGLIVVGSVRVPRVTVRQETTATTSRLIVETAPASPTTVTLDGRRLLVNIDAVAIDPSIGSLVNDGYVSAVSAAPPTSLAIDLGPKFTTYSASQATEGQNGRLTIDFAPGAMPGPTPAPTTAAGDTPTLGPPPEAPPMLTPLPGVRTIVLDPGHGGPEAGSRGASGTAEKALTLAVARQLKAVIESRLGLRVLLTRSGDEAAGADARAAIANNNKADLFISLHANASPRPAVAGAEVYFLSLADYGPEAQNVASAATPIPVVGGGTRPIDVVPWELAQAPHIGASERVAELVQSSLASRVPMSARPLARAPLRGLVGVNMPAVLVEMGYLTNAADERRLASADGQARIVEALFESIVRFRDEGASTLPPETPGATGASPR